MKRGVLCRRGHDEWDRMPSTYEDVGYQYVCIPCRRASWAAGSAAYRASMTPTEREALRRRDRLRKKKKRMAAEVVS